MLRCLSRAHRNMDRRSFNQCRDREEADSLARRSPAPDTVLHKAFCYAVLNGMSLRDALEFSNAMAALNGAFVRNPAPA